jgi:hypothetical protein
MKVTIRDQMGVNIAEGEVTWVIDPQLNAEYIAAFQVYGFPLTDKNGTFLGQLEVTP